MHPVTFKHEKGTLSLSSYETWRKAELKAPTKFNEIETEMDKLTTIFLSKCWPEDMGHA